MIRLYAMKTDALPSREELLRQIVLLVDEQKLNTLKSASDERARESLSGVLLLQRSLERTGFSPVGERLCYESLGRPYLESEIVKFSLAHTLGFSVCALEIGDAFSTSCIGVDVERMQNRTPKSMERIADRWFTADEKMFFFQSSDERRFLQIWTGKEALSKQSGKGLGEIALCDAIRPQKDMKLQLYEQDGVIVTVCHSSREPSPEAIEWIQL